MYNQPMKIAVIGAGASGIFAALQAAWLGADVTLLEHNAVIGKKLLVTGSGRCNITNAAISPEKYTCADSHWLAQVFQAFGVQGLLALLDDLGIPVSATADGWYYPLSNSAHSVVMILQAALIQAGVHISLQTHVGQITKAKQGFHLSYTCAGEAGWAIFDRLIVAAGGCAQPGLGASGKLLTSLEALGHTVLPPHPALAPVLATLGAVKALQGLRFDVAASLWQHNEKICQTQGNLIFTEWGLNGPAVMDLSHHISAYPVETLTLSLDFLALCRPQFDALLARQRHTSQPLLAFLSAFFVPKSATFFLKNLHLNPDAPLAEVNDSALQTLRTLLTDLRLPVKGVRGFDFCQVSSGGVPVTEVSPLTFESGCLPALYLTGETLDVVGRCGGYNLQFAFSSGVLAGKSAGQPQG